MKHKLERHSQDILTALREVLKQEQRAGTADSDVNVFALPVSVPRVAIEAAITEIENLRSLVGKAQAGPSFADISTAAMRSGVQTIKFEDAPNVKQDA